MSGRTTRLGDLYEFLPKSSLKASDGRLAGCFPFFTSSPYQTRWTDIPAFDAEALVFATGGTAAVHHVAGQFAASADCLVAAPRREKAVHPRFSYHYLNWNLRALEAGFRGAGLRHVSKGFIEELALPVFTVAEQRRIAEILDKADALRAKRRTALPRLDTLTQSIFIAMFGDPATNPMEWPTRPLMSLVRDDDTINYGVVQPGDDCVNGVPLVRVGDLLEGRVSHTALKRIHPSIEAAYKRSRLRGDELLVSCVGSIGVVALADESLKGFNIARAVARIPLGSTTSRVFMAAYLKTDFVQRYFTRELRTVSQPTLNIKQLSETLVVLPPPNSQAEFEARVAVIERAKTSQRASRVELDALFAALQHRAFRGEL